MCSKPGDWFGWFSVRHASTGGRGGDARRRCRPDLDSLPVWCITIAAVVTNHHGSPAAPGRSQRRVRGALVRLAAGRCSGAHPRLPVANRQASLVSGSAAAPAAAAVAKHAAARIHLARSCTDSPPGDLCLTCGPLQAHRCAGQSAVARRCALATVRGRGGVLFKSRLQPPRVAHRLAAAARTARAKPHPLLPFEGWGVRASHLAASGVPDGV